jgi:hypothetical protein
MYYILIINTNSNINIFTKNVYSNNELFSAAGLRYINSILFIYILLKKNCSIFAVEDMDFCRFGWISLSAGKDIIKMIL